MSNLELTEALCQIIQQQISIIRELASALSQERSLTAAEKASIKTTEARYSEIIGSGE